MTFNGKKPFLYRIRPSFFLHLAGHTSLFGIEAIFDFIQTWREFLRIRPIIMTFRVFLLKASLFFLNFSRSHFFIFYFQGCYFV